MSLILLCSNWQAGLAHEQKSEDLLERRESILRKSATGRWSRDCDEYEGSVEEEFSRCVEENTSLFGPGVPSIVELSNLRKRPIRSGCGMFEGTLIVRGEGVPGVETGLTFILPPRTLSLAEESSISKIGVI